ncbi:uncharacterized protein LOC128901350 [Rissa tridactyla]|uniref:uncharacterized protein LOC128901350 n=1 Tax=Rissa tridactyla TaxID=75485 RepID=UPI0023BA684D|nr:uncharacterized protein LOC128901350 [Rissa tridactyla]XP_054039292.1 uncharacterized protein LOC128901350 [Rissa tridactyla]
MRGARRGVQGARRARNQARCARSQARRARSQACKGPGMQGARRGVQGARHAGSQACKGPGVQGARCARGQARRARGQACKGPGEVCREPGEACREPSVQGARRGVQGARRAATQACKGPGVQGVRRAGSQACKGPGKVCKGPGEACRGPGVQGARRASGQASYVGSQACKEPGEACREPGISAAACPDPFSRQRLAARHEMSPVLLCCGARRPGSAPQPRACEQERPSPAAHGVQNVPSPPGSGRFSRRNLSLGSGTVLNLTSSLPGSVPSLGGLWGTKGPRSWPLAVPFVLGGDPGACSPAPSELPDLPLPTLLDPRQMFFKEKSEITLREHPPVRHFCAACKLLHKNKSFPLFSLPPPPSS